MNLNFKSLIDTPWILNAVIPVSENFHLSINYNKSLDGLWYDCEKDNYKIEIQVGFPPSTWWDIVKVSKDISNVYPGRNDSMIYSLIEIAETLKYAGEFEVFEIRDKNVKSREWGHRFFCAKGNDLEDKLSYIKRVFIGEDKSRFKEE